MSASARPVRRTRLKSLGALVAAALLQAAAVAQPAPSAPVVRNSDLDAQLFYQLLVGELQLREGEPGVAYQVILDAARRTRDEALYRRATDIALQARAGEQALAAADAWRQALPGSAEAQRYVIQILVALNRPAETVEPMRALIRIAEPSERAATIQALPRFFARSSDRTAAAGILEQALLPALADPALRVAARVAIGRAWLAVPDASKALDALRQANADDPAAEAPPMLAIALLSSSAAAEAIVKSHLAAVPDSHGVRLAYIRALTTAQRYVEAIRELETVTTRAPQIPGPWLTLGALQLELRHPAEATAALQTFLARLEATPAPASPTASAAADDDDDEATTSDVDVEAGTANADQGRSQAWLMLAQAAEQQRDFKAAEAWLAKIDQPQRVLEVQSRRASLLARQGRVDEARQLVRNVPERDAGDARAKLIAEAQLLREAKQWAPARTVLQQANERFPGDVELLYEQSMVAEKLNRLDEMERLLRRVIELKPDHHHAYNALGYSLAERNLRLDEAKTLIQKALSLSPGEPFITDSLGWVEYRLGNKAEALRLLRGAYESRPDPEIAAHLGELLWVTGDRDAARKVWREGKARDAANEVLKETLARLRVDL